MDPVVLAEPFRTHIPELLELMVPALDAAPAERATEPVWILQVRECLAAACPGSGPLSSVWPTSFA